jgi:phosphate:Na+ symporter
VLVVKDEKIKGHRHPELHTLDEHLYISPAVAVEEGTKAVAAMGSIALLNFAKACGQLLHFDESQLPDIDADEDCLDQFADRSDRFLVGLSKVVETEVDDRQVDMLLQVVPCFERVGDYATNMVELSQRLVEANTTFSDAAKQELEIISGAVNDILNITLTAFAHNDNNAAKAIEPLEEVIDDMVMILRDRHTKRLKSGACTVDTGLVFMETLTYLERASDQCSSIAVMMMARDNETILHNHYDYLKQIHEGNDAAYAAEKDRRREQYIDPLKQIM